jgi:hypothetical protein
LDFLEFQFVTTEFGLAKHLNTSLADIEHGNVNRCFLDTLTDPFLLLVALIAGQPTISVANSNIVYRCFLDTLIDPFLLLVALIAGQPTISVANSNTVLCTAAS